MHCAWNLIFCLVLMIKSNLVTCRIIVKNTCSERITAALTLHLGQNFKFSFSSRPFLQMESNAESSVYTDESGFTLIEVEWTPPTPKHRLYSPTSLVAFETLLKSASLSSILQGKFSIQLFSKQTCTLVESLMCKYFLPSFWRHN